MIPYIGDFILGQTLHIPHNTFAAAGESITRATNGSIKIFKGSSITQRTSSAGVIDTEDHDGDTGTHLVSIDTSDNTDSGFYAPGNDYYIKVAGETIDGKSINRWVGHFSIENRGLVHAYYEAAASGGSTTYADLPSGANTTDDHYNDAFVVITHANGTKEYAYASDYVGSTTRRLSLNKTLQAAVVSGDRVQIFPSAKALVNGVVQASMVQVNDIAADAVSLGKGAGLVKTFTVDNTAFTATDIAFEVSPISGVSHPGNIIGRPVYFASGNLSGTRRLISNAVVSGSYWRITLDSVCRTTIANTDTGVVG